MKKSSVIISLLATVVFSFVGITSCSNGVTPPVKENLPNAEETVKDSGNAQIKFLVPDYYALANSGRAIAPQTAKVRFSYFNVETGKWVEHSTIKLPEVAEKIPNSPAGFPASVYTIVFENIPSYGYPAGCLKLDLLNNMNDIISSGTNSERVSISMGNTTRASFYTVPVSSSADEGALAQGEMKFLAKSFISGKTYTINIELTKGSKYPDIVLFDNKGSFLKYIPMNSNSVTLDKETEHNMKFIGVWADEGEDVYYKMTFTSTGTTEGEITNSDFTAAGFGTGTSFGAEWTISSTQGSEPQLNNGIVTFNYRAQSDASLARTLIVSKDTALSFDVEPSIYAPYDGYLDFYINGTKVDSFTGKDGKRNVHYILKEGVYDIKWQQNDPIDSATNGGGYNLYVKLSNIKAEDANLDYTLKDGFGTGPKFSYDWTVKGPVMPTFVNEAQDGSAAIKMNYYDFGIAETSMLRTVKVPVKSLVSFNVKTNIDESTDGYVEFYVDGVKQEYYTGRKGAWANYKYLIDEGRHDLSWKFIGTSTSRYQDCYALLSNLKVETAPEPDFTLNDGFGKGETLSYDWKVKGSKQPVLVIGAAGASGNKALEMNFKNLGTEVVELSRKIDALQSSIVNFSVFTDITPEYDGAVEFWIDGIKQGTYTGTNKNHGASCYVDKGMHNLVWKFVGAYSGYTGGSVTWKVKLDNLGMKDFIVPTTMNETFDEIPVSQVIAGSGIISTDSVFDKWNENMSRAEGVLTDTHKNVYALASDQNLIVTKVDAQNGAALSFDYKCDVYDDNVLKVFVDDVEQTTKYGGYGKKWMNASVILPAGLHTVELKNTQIGTSPQLTNAIYIDNITLASDVTDSVDIYPKGLQETYVNGDPIQFTGKALRADGSVREGANVTYSVSGGGTITETGLFTPNGTEGIYTVTTSVDGKSATNTTVKVHGQNYIDEPITIAGHEFTGGNESIADGFFVLKGNASSPMSVVVKKRGTALETSYMIRQGAYAKRIWLRFGQGEYDVTINRSTFKLYNTQDPKYEGDIDGPAGWTNYPIRNFTVRNTSDVFTEEEAKWLMPSDVVQSDDFIVSNAVHAVLAELPSNATVADKLRALHDWELYTRYYDKISLNHPEKRKRQDAVHSIKYGMSVCEGYANTYAAFARFIGVQTKVPTGGNHAWNNVYYNNAWYLVDVTWDDPVPASAGDSYNDIAADSENYTYFMTGFDDGKHVNPGTPDTGRSAVSVPVLPKMRGMPDGWY